MDELLRKIDEVRNRTNVDYVEAKVALDNCGGDVLEAVIYIEQKRQSANKRANIKSTASNVSSDIIDKLKELIKKGNVVRVLVKKNDAVIMNIPVAAGIVGVIAFTTASVVSVVAAIAMGCRIYVVRKDNTIFEVRELLEGTAGNVKNVAQNVSSTISKRMSKDSLENDDELNEGEIEELEQWLFSEEDNELLENQPSFKEVKYNNEVKDEQNNSEDK